MHANKKLSCFLFQRDNWVKSWKEMLKDTQTFAKRLERGHDQEILSRHIWPWAQSMSMQHDSYL